MKKLITILMMAFAVAMVSCEGSPTGPKIDAILTSEMLKLDIPIAIKTAIEKTTAAVPKYDSGGKATLPNPPSVSVSDIAASITVKDIMTTPDAAVIVPTEAVLAAFNDALQPGSTIVNGVVPNNAFTVTWVLEPDVADPILTLSGTAIAKPGYFIPDGLDEYAVRISLTSGGGGKQDQWAVVPK